MDSQELLITETGFIDSVLTEATHVRVGCLGKLSGPIADYKESTRNKRFYSKKLWEKVFNTPWVKEAIETKTLFGEADHPADRLETKLKEAAVVLTSYSFDDKESCVRGEFDILDTPNGRILKALADYGCRLGVSSRGRGKTNKVGDRQVVDESSYLFGGFDVVTLPAVKKARQDYVGEPSIEVGESTDFDTMTDTIMTQINECSSTNDLKVIKNILEGTELPEIVSLTEAINSKINELSESPDNTIVIEGLTKDLKQAYDTIEELKSSTNVSEANTISNEEYMADIQFMNTLVKENADYLSTINSLKQELVSKIKEVNNLKESVETLKVQAIDAKLQESVDSRTSNEQQLAYESLQEEVNTLTNSLNAVKIRRDSLKERVKNLSEELETVTSEKDALVEEISSLKATIEQQTRELEKSVNSYNELVEESTNSYNQLAEESANEYNTLAEQSTNEYNELVNDYNQVYEEYSKLLDNHVKSLCQKLGVSKGTFINLLPENYSVDDVNSLYEAQLLIKKKLNKLPIATTNESLEQIVSANAPKLTNDKYINTRSILKSMK